MEQNLSNDDSTSESICVQPTEKVAEAPKPLRRLYFINEIVEWHLTQYLWTGCTKVALRDAIMSHATELIRQIIRKQGLHTIYPGQEESAFGDLLQTAWVQIERTLYKYRARPHCRTCFNPDRPAESLLYEPQINEYGIKPIDEILAMYKGHRCPKCNTLLSATPLVEPVQGYYGGSETILYRGMSKVFNMWSQIARTVILAFIKKEGRDRKNSTSYMTHLGNKNKPVSGILTNFLDELRDMWQFHSDYLKIIDAIAIIFQTDDRPHDGIIGKLVEHTGLSRTIVVNFIQTTKLRSFELSHSNLNRGVSEVKIDRRKGATEFEDES
jgi:hypothetical protein